MKHLSHWQNQIECVIVGGALGWDTAVALCAASLKIPFELYLPNESYVNHFKGHNRERLLWQMKYAQRLVIVSTNDDVKSLFDRNHAMVDAADKVLALRDPQKKRGGTVECMNYAAKQKKPIHNMWTDFKLLMSDVRVLYQADKGEWDTSDFHWLNLANYESGNWY